ncbi:hypothetical protein M8J71_00745 [Pseudarthrobacter sp. R1]|uniref:hypothetical protein n=1 Tax=Pseudarthrobacter sp. R1 TaxID=2944934 RepID=UPI0021092711|nr:hypothetical protein [Pseudarthrobacter sp. R1]MCQ6269034.1 hypothetical protein [Pseudarthrobacter sp. R1]
MSAISSKETVLHVSAADAEPLNLRLDAGAAVNVRVEVQGNCTCQGGAARRPGSYTDTDFGTR